MNRQPINQRLAVSLLLVPCLLLSVVTLGSSDADALQSGPECDTGIWNGTVCVIEGAPPVPGPATCPVSPTVVQNGTECYTLVPAESVCPDGAAEVGNECQQAVADVAGELSCADGFSLEVNECVRYEAPAGLTCTNGTLVGINCVIQGPPPVEGPATCPVSATVILTGNECYTLVSAPLIPGTCDAPYITFGSVCKANNTGTTQAEVFAFICPTAPPGTTITTNMHTVGAITKIESCQYSPTTTPGPCPAGTTPDPNGTDCRRPVDLRPGALTCTDGFGLVNNECVRYEAPVLEDECQVGDLTDNGCRIVGSPPVPGPATCPESALGVPGSCYVLVAAEQVCPAGTTPDLPAGIDCRQAVDLVPGPLTCADGYALVSGSCIRTEAPIYRCYGLVVTINMRLGAGGEGTSSDDVILGTSAADTINGRGGNDMICARGGDDIITGGSGDDTIYGQGGNDDIRGGSGDDTIYGQGGNDDIRGGSGNDEIRGGNDNDIIRGGQDSDTLFGNRGDDELRGGSGDDTIRGGQDNDTLIGGSDTDSCNGNAGTDTASASCETATNIP